MRKVSCSLLGALELFEKFMVVVVGGGWWSSDNTVSKVQVLDLRLKTFDFRT